MVIEPLMKGLSRRLLLALLLFLILTLSLTVVVAQDVDPGFDPYPLQPPDTSSPRDTLRSFLTNAKTGIQAYVQGTQSAVSDRARRSAAAALDFSATPEGDAWSVQIEHVLLLKEILDRIELPLETEIPGDEEVAHGSVIRWAIPNTRITIARMEYGPREGDFLFSAATVERLYRSYLSARNLPYKPSASSPGIYETWSRTSGEIEMQLRNRLRSINTSSPRSTLTRLVDTITRAHTLVTNANMALKTEPPRLTRTEARKIEAEANNLLRRATKTLDLSKVPRAHRRATGIEAVLKLKEILDRTIPPRLENIPDVATVAAARQRENPSFLQPDEPFRWRYPNSEIEIVEIMEGDRQGEFLFSSGTVSQINDNYERLRELPYATVTLGRASDRLWADQSQGFYEFVFTNPGGLIPQLSVLGKLVDSLPGWVKRERGGNAWWKWIGLVLCVLAVALAVIVVLRVLKILAGKLYAPLDSWLMILQPVLIMFIVLAVSNFIDVDLNLTGVVRTAVRTCSQTIVIIMMIWAVVRLSKTVAETVIASPRIQERSLDATLFRIMARIVSFVIGGWIVIASVRDLGADLVPLLAGLGVGGLAIALAAQRTFANFIGTLILSVNKPVKVGDFCRYGDQIGTVEHIGLLATRIRSLERTIVTVPNAEFSEMKLDNFAVRDLRLLNTVLQLRYQTTPEQMRYILARMRELLLRHPKVTPDPARVRFIGYGAYSKDVQIFAYLSCQDQNTFLAMQEDVLLRIEDIVNEAGSGFAFPSQTAYLTRDKGLDRERGVRAEARVQRWRAGGTLPFPEFEDQQRERMQDTLDYPPKGSPGYVRPDDSVDGPARTGPSTFSVEDFVDLPSFASKLQEPTQISNYLWSRLSTRTQVLLANYSSEADRRAREALVQDLNVIIQGPSIYAIDRFSGIEHRRQTRELLEAKPEGEQLALLNRLLLEDAYPNELQPPRPASETPTS